MGLSEAVPARHITYQLGNMYAFLLLLGCVTSSPLLRVKRQSSAMVLVPASETQGEGISRAVSRQSSLIEDDIHVPAGEAVDIFYRYGFFSLSVRVVPRDDHGTWLVREPTTKVFTPTSLEQVKQVESNKFAPQFQIFFCDDIEDLMKQYFHDFSAEGVKEPFRLYTGSWRTPTTVKYFGLSEETLHSDSGFVLVKLLKPRLTVKTEGSPILKADAAKAFADIEIGDVGSVKEFSENFGSHYIRSLTVGDAVYQILALDRDQYVRAKTDVLIKESGKVQIASGDSDVADFLENRVVLETQFSSYPSIFEIRKNEDLLSELELLTHDTEAVIALAFRSIGALLPSVQLQDFYNEIVDTQLALWEVNI